MKISTGPGPVPSAASIHSWLMTIASKSFQIRSSPRSCTDGTAPDAAHRSPQAWVSEAHWTAVAVRAVAVEVGPAEVPLHRAATPPPRRSAGSAGGSRPRGRRADVTRSRRACRPAPSPRDRRGSRCRCRSPCGPRRPPRPAPRRSTTSRSISNSTRPWMIASFWSARLACSRQHRMREHASALDLAFELPQRVGLHDPTLLASA